jgi:threonine dehydrogenase-like Zn-dependent dehydrogenase
VAVFGLGAVGLAVIEAAKRAGAARIFAVDINTGERGMQCAGGQAECARSAPSGSAATCAPVCSGVWCGAALRCVCAGATCVAQPAGCGRYIFAQALAPLQRSLRRPSGGGPPTASTQRTTTAPSSRWVAAGAAAAAGAVSCMGAGRSHFALPVWCSLL